MTKVKRQGLAPPCRVPGKRGAVSGLSVASGLRLQDTISAVDSAHGMPLFVTLTYPADWPGDWTIWKCHLDNYRRGLAHLLGSSFVGGIWRLEAQRRGAPHFHVLLWAQSVATEQDLSDFRCWTSEVWYRLVGSGDEKHLRAGTQVRRLADDADLQAVMGYLGKYLGKDSVHPESQVFKNPVGRYWGVWGKARLLKPPLVATVDREAYLGIRRVLRSCRERRRKGKPRRGGKEAANRTPQRELQAPGLRCFLRERDARKLLDCYDEPPF